MKTKTVIQKKLFELQDAEYRQFQCRLMPNIDPDTVIGVRTPQLRRLAKELFGQPSADAFLHVLPHAYYEENNLHAFLIEEVKDYEKAVDLINQFLPYVDNWATCDQMSPKVFAKHRQELLKEIRIWIHSERTYTIRFGIGALMRFYLDASFKEPYLKMVSAIHSEEYYVNMMSAWFFATALAKQYESTLPYIEKHCLDPWVHNKAIQKAIESRRITPEQKAYLKTLKIK
ncbi:MAG: DNA alkylation repair protein [Solobacterium sp.]|jgi:3-methyladenine DNA glycosylase AlkD|nr:DNA alkylation repair protein [Solobacterium sp.]MCH4205090.1 DNA alkylation repair protein [Solobacterium sp.]MCH4226683.1 DNA alkylation repair protein [Solobacterium sp.]MCH4281988.1 DNA alkylation repair protein [Solobacterium sp.]